MARSRARVTWAKSWHTPGAGGEHLGRRGLHPGAPLRYSRRSLHPAGRGLGGGRRRVGRRGRISAATAAISPSQATVCVGTSSSSNWSRIAGSAQVVPRGVAGLGRVGARLDHGPADDRQLLVRGTWRSKWWTTVPQ